METCATPLDDDCDGAVNEDGADCACTPGSSKACYSGSADTLDVGACKGGTQVCNVDGTGYGPCFGEVTPSAETCATPIDDDCDGELNEEGAGCACVPDSTESCYSGPAGTAGVGKCVSGTRLCDALGTGWGACTGEVLPTVDLCGGIADENCDGSLDEGCAAWAQLFGGTGIERGYVAVNPAQTDDTYVGGWYSETIDLKTGVTPTAPGAFLARLTNSGGVDWAKAFPGQAAEINGVASFGSWGSGATVFVAGKALGPMDFGGGPLPSVSGTTPDLVLAAFDWKSAHVWSKRFESDGEMSVWEVVGAQSAFVIGGYAKGSLDLGAGTLAPIGDSDLFLAAYNATGQTLWSRRFGDPVGKFGAANLGVVAGSNVLLVSYLYGAFDFGGGLLPPNRSVIAALDWNGGAHLWSKSLAMSDLFEVEDIALDAQGNIFVLGAAWGPVDLGGGSLGGSSGWPDVVIAKLDSSGAHQWSKRFPGSGQDFGHRVAVLPSGDVIAMGVYANTIQFGDQPLSGGSKGGTFVVRVDGGGQHVYSRAFAHLSTAGVPSQALSLAASLTGSVIGTLNLTGPIDLGVGVVNPINPSDALVFAIPGS